MKSYVITHNKILSNSEIVFVNKSPCALIRNLRKESGNGIKLFDEVDNAMKLDLAQTIRSDSGIAVNTGNKENFLILL